MVPASVIIPAYNEEQNIRPLLERVHAENREGCLLDDVIVVASGCTDRTVERAREMESGWPQLRVIEQARREGKSSAINAGLAAARHDNVVLISGDVLPAPGAVARLLGRLDNPRIGVVGARPVPQNDASSLSGFATKLMWRLHHEISLAATENPKCGEMIAFRRMLDGKPVVTAIPARSAVDEVSIQAIAAIAGFKSAYEPEAIVHNWGPATMRDWFVQRRRINVGHLLSVREGYRPATMRTSTIVQTLLRDADARHRPLSAALVVGMEALARLAATVDIARGRDHAVWRVASSTKRAIEQETG